MSRIANHSRDCRPNTVFAAMPGTASDGHQFVLDAVSRGARALLCERPLAEATVPQCIVPNVRSAYAEVCAALHSYPSRRLKIAGVTGTNGKTTATWLIRSMLEQAGHSAGLVGTIEYSDGRIREASSLTTPDAGTMFEWMGRMVRHGTRQCAIELSSHALCQGRVAGAGLATAIITNITHDHFDYHGDYESYWKAKARITEYLDRGGVLGINIDDPGARRFLKSRIPGVELRTFAVDQEADLQAEIVSESIEGTRFVLRDRSMSGLDEIEIQTVLVGRHNVSNILASATAARNQGCTLGDIAQGVANLQHVPGRLERVDAWKSFPVFVDYAHTPDALTRCIDFLRPWVRGKLIVVFGAGGDRDPSKRPLMARAVQNADVAIITSDNPRSEDPERIIQQITSGFTATQTQTFCEKDRRTAIREAIAMAVADDCVVIAGKGHETYQVIGSETLEFDDRLVARSALHTRGLLASDNFQRKRA